ncbi:unnamed protein product [Leptidea sinapis]|uniref:Uncharacterized protein n=1 Tax=Leptidea sinapis TaxID=189913 RepID=A0A5E4Q5F3_9NEOP|nr:unnamed protein product [Leptidea sinapis]
MEGECSEGEGWLLVRVHVPELNVQKSLQFSRDQLVWDVKQQCLAALPKEEKLSIILNNTGILRRKKVTKKNCIEMESA